MAGESYGILPAGGCGYRWTKLLYPDNTVQHAGVVVGIAGFAGHILTGYDRNAMGYLWRLGVAQDEVR